MAGGGLLLGGILSRSFWLTAGGYVLGSFVWSNGYPSLMALISERSGRRFGAAIAFKWVLTAVFGAAGVAGVGWLSDELGYERMWLAMLLPACGFVLLGLGGAAWVACFDKGRPSATRA